MVLVDPNDVAALKDLLAAAAGAPLRSGSRFYRDHVPTHDSEIVRRYRAAGLILPAHTLPDGRVWRNVSDERVARVAESLADFRARFAYNLADEHVHPHRHCLATGVHGRPPRSRFRDAGPASGDP